MPKILFLVADGMAGWPLEDMNNQTTLEAAETPVMDTLAAKGICGRCQTVPLGMPPGSDVANMALLGYDPRQFHTGRGPIEAAAQGLKLEPDDLVWRMNLVSMSGLAPGDIMHDYSSGHISTDVSTPLVQHLSTMAAGSPFEPVPGIQYRHLLVQKHGALTNAATLEVRPPHDILDQAIDQDLLAFATYPDLQAFIRQAHTYLAAEPTSKATSIWPWGQGKPLLLPSFTSQYGMHGAVISAVDLVKGLGRAADMDVLEVPNATGLIDTNYAGKVEAALEFLKTGDFVYLHVEAPDECGHMGDAMLKKRSIELFDQNIVKPLVTALADTDIHIVITCDHFTPVARRTHTDDAVPFLIYRSHGPTLSGPASFNERTAEAAGLRLSCGEELLNLARAPR